MKDKYPEPISAFASYKRTIQGCSALTVSEYCLDVSLFFRYITAVRDGKPYADIEETDISMLDYELCDSIKTTEVYEYLVYLADVRDNTARTRARRLSAIKAFYKYHTVKSHKLQNNPTKDIDSPKVKPAPPRFLTLDESEKLLASVDATSPNYARDYCILTLFLNCGIRLAELCGINLNDIDSELRSMRVTGKGGKTRVIYLNEACKDAITGYLLVRQQLGRHSNTPIIDKNALFLSERGKRISRSTVQKMIEKQLDTAGLGGRGFSTHKLRHTAATLMYQEGGVDVRVLKDILGHEQLNTTQIYTHVSDSQMESAMAANPLSHKKSKKRIQSDD